MIHDDQMMQDEMIHQIFILHLVLKRFPWKDVQDKSL